jgi:hypothetical protein
VKAFNLGVIATRFSMVSSRHYPIVDDQNGSDSGIRARPAERLFCLA